MDYSRKISERLWNLPDKGELESRREETFIDDIIQKSHIEKELLSHLDGIETVFDGGAGSGRFSILLAKQGCSIVHFDISQPMIDKARELAEREGVLDRITFVKGALEDLKDFDDKSFDMVISFDAHISYTYPHQEQVIGELVRICKKRIVLSVSSRLGSLPYFANPINKRQFLLDARIKDVDLKFVTEPTLFSPNSIDNGTLAMLTEVDFLPGDKVLDLGCGYGVAGILAGKLIGGESVIMCDISEQAVKYAAMNATLNYVPHIDIRFSDGYQNVPEKDFTLILCNPPYHADFSVPKKFIEVGFRKLAMGGKLVMVTKRLDWYKNKLTSVFGGVKVQEIGGYYVFVAEKRSQIIKKKKKPEKRLSKKLQRKQKLNPRSKLRGIHSWLLPSERSKLRGIRPVMD